MSDHSSSHHPPGQSSKKDNHHKSHGPSFRPEAVKSSNSNNVCQPQIIDEIPKNNNKEIPADAASVEIHNPSAGEAIPCIKPSEG